MAEYGVKLEDLENPGQPIFTVHGHYRRVWLQPRNWRTKILRYQDPEAPLLRTALDVFEERMEAGEGEGAAEGQQPNQGEEMDGESELDPIQAAQDDPEGQETAVVLSFDLPKSSYATVLLREVMKTSTARDDQIALTTALVGFLLPSPPPLLSSF